MLNIRSYDRYRAVEYAKKWALSRNPIFENFTGIGGDCTNFVSQSVYAGSCEMNFTRTFGWYFRSLDDRAPAWTGVEAFYDFFTGSGDFSPTSLREGPFGYVTERRYAQLGDVIQLANEDGDFYHTLIITGFDGEDILVSAHSDDSLDRPLSSYTNASERIIHIIGVLVPEEDADALPDCFERIIGE